MAVETFNSSGDRVVRTTDSQGITRNGAGDPVSQQQANAADRSNATAARNAKQSGNMQEAASYVDKIVDPNLRIKLFSEIFGAKGNQTPPASLFKQDSGGISNPSSLFFLMVFYLDKQNPNFNWSDVLNAAKLRSNSAFITSTPNNSFLPTESTSDQKPVLTTEEQIAQVSSEIRENVKRNEEGVKNQMPKPTNSAGASDGGVSKVVVWPIQNMPLINGGVTKSVNWDKAKVQATTFAEPTLAINGGASHVDIDIEFVYAVGLPGLGENIPAGDTVGMGKEDFWTAEEVLGMAYLAMSLVLPYQSASLIGNEGKAGSGKQGAPYFPVLFLRHCSLFPYLTPFVVKQIKIEPDEGQPLIVTEKNMINRTDMSLDYASVRQTLKITLSLQSAHYYLTVFQGNETGAEIKKLTSGQTYLNNAKALLQGRV